MIKFRRAPSLKRPGQILKDALDAFYTLIKTKRFNGAMFDFIDPDNGPIVDICIAGAWLPAQTKTEEDMEEVIKAFSVDMSVRKTSNLQRVPKAQSKITDAIEQLRHGNVTMAFDLLGIKKSTDLDRSIHRYPVAPMGFKRDLYKLAKDLTEAGF